MSKYEQKSFIYNLDFLSGTPRIFISGHKNFSTLIGLIATVFILIISIFYTIYALYIFFFEREMTVVELKDNFITKEVRNRLNEFLFAFNVFNVSMKIEYFWGKEINYNSGNFSKTPLNKNYIVNLIYENPENKEIIKKYELDLEYCEIGKNINQELIDKYNFTGYKNYLCLSNKSSNFDIVINKTYNTYIDIVVSINLDNETNLNYKVLYSDESSILYEMNYFEFQMYSPNDIISNQNISNPIKLRKNYFNHELASPGILEYTQINTKFIEYLSDNGFIIKSKDKFKCFSIESITKTTKDRYSYESSKNLIYNEIILYINPDIIESFERTYKKLPAVIADISGIFSLLFNIGQFIVGFICKVFLEVGTISRVIKYKLKSSEIKLKNNNKIIKMQNDFGYKSSQRRINTDLFDNMNQKIKTINTRYNRTNSNYREYNVNNELSLINNDISQKKLSEDNIDSQKNNYNNQLNKNYKQKDINLPNKESSNEKKKENVLYSLNDNNENKTFKKFNYNQYSEIFCKVLGIFNTEKKKNSINSNPFYFNDYFSFILNKNKNNRTKIIDKLSCYFEDILSIEEIIGKTLDLENINCFIKMKLRKKFTTTEYLKILLKKDNVFKKIMEDEYKNILVNNIAK